jgi:Zn-dependent protease with chaperone function
VRWVLLLLVLVSLALSGIGCASGSSEANWVKMQGGVLIDPRQQKAEDSLALLGAYGRGLHVQVLNNETIGANSWRDGSIFVTRALVDLLDQQELAAVMAHEMGHLLNDGHLQGAASLRGCCVNPDAEVRADATGVELMRIQGINPEVMATMLKKVKGAIATSSPCQQGLATRIGLLGGRLLAAPPN